MGGEKSCDGGRTRSWSNLGLTSKIDWCKREYWGYKVCSTLSWTIVSNRMCRWNFKNLWSIGYCKLNILKMCSWKVYSCRDKYAYKLFVLVQKWNIGEKWSIGSWSKGERNVERSWKWRKCKEIYINLLVFWWK